MPGIRVDTPIGDGWEYSFDNVHWQTNPVFRNWIGGSAFVEGATYTVYCLNLATNERATNSILYKSPGNSTSNPPGLNDVMHVDDTTDIAPHFNDGLFAHLEDAPDNEIIRRVGIGADGKFYLLDDSALDGLDTPQKKDAFLQDLINAMSEQTHAMLCEKMANCPLPPTTIAPMLDQFEFYELIPNEEGQLPPALDEFEFFEFTANDSVVVPPATPLFRVRMDGNNCSVSGNFGVVDGWVIDLNNPNEAQTVTIKRDGVLRANVLATIDRPDVRDYLISQGLIPPGTTFARYGYTLAKIEDDHDGEAHDWRVYAPDGTEAISETGALNTVTCGTSGPTIVQQVIGGVISLYEGENGEVWVNNNYSNNTQGFYTDGGAFSMETPYPDGVIIQMIANGRARITVPENCISADVVRALRFTFPDNNRVISESFTLKNINAGGGANHAPTVNFATQFLTAQQGSAFDHPVPISSTFVDADNDPLTYTMDYSPDGGTTWQALPGWCSYAGGHFVGTPPITSGNSVNYRFRVTANDGRGGSVSDPFNLICFPLN